MRYSDSQRVDRMRVTTRKFLDYLEGNGITQARILARRAPALGNYDAAVQYRRARLSGQRRFQGQTQRHTLVKIAGLRHRLVHDYENTNWSLICAALFEVLPAFLPQIEAIRDRGK